MARRRQSGPRPPGVVVYELRADDLISLAINVVQNGWDWRELRPDLVSFVGGSATKPRGRGQSGDGPASDAIRMMLEEVYREILRAHAQHVGANDSLPPAHCGPLPPSPGYSSDKRD